MPLNIRVGKYSMPVTAVIGGLGTATVWVVVVLTHATGRTVGLSWMAVGIVMYVVYRRRQGFSLTKTVKVVPLPESVSTDIDYDQLLVPIVGSRITDEMMVLACQLATEKQSSIDALYVIEVPMNLPLDARLPKERESAERGARPGAPSSPTSSSVKMTPIVVTARPGRAGDRRRGARIAAPRSSSSARTRKRRIAERVVRWHDQTTCSSTRPARC